MDRLLIDLDVDGGVSVSTWLDGQLPSGPVGSTGLVWPLDPRALEDLRWYLEEYLFVPFGVYGDKGPRVAARLRPWGEGVFEAVFGAGPARDVYMQRVANAVGPVELVFRSAAPGLLGLPWELIWQPGRASPAALDGVLVTRSLPDVGLADPFDVAGEQLRVLMVISRPDGPRDVPYQLVARRLVACLGAVRGEVDLVVLRPPTLEALATELMAARDAGEPFQVVHFDGHGLLPGRHDLVAPAGGLPLTFQTPAPEGVLLFETPTGGGDRVAVSAVARVLAEARVPVVVLNACQSGAVGTQVEAAVATRLLGEGVASVVAMAYNVFTDAVAEFMAAFYDRLFGGDVVSQAVGAGRRWMAQRPLRTSTKGRLSLQDWMVPVHYMRRPVRFPQLRTHRAGGTTTGGLLDALRDQAGETDQRNLVAAGNAFVGRDGLFYELEKALRHQHVVLLHGPGGGGKTELARAFGRWWQNTRGVERPEWVLWQSFTPGVPSFGLDQVVAQIGRDVIGGNFSRLEPQKQRRVVDALLAEHRLLLIWDNFESVFSMPDPTSATPPLEATQRDELRAFVKRVADGRRSSVIITSRSTEAWLEPIVRPIRVGGLTFTEANQYTDLVLAGYANAQHRRAHREFGELTEWLAGHPMAMNLVLPHLDTTDPDAILAGLRGTAAPPWDGTNADGDRDTSLPASLAYSYHHIDPRDRPLLLAVSLFHGVAVAGVLAIFSGQDDVPQQFRGHDHQSWKAALKRAADVGLLTAVGDEMYVIHPALPAYLVEQWRTEAGQDYDRQRAQADAALQAAHVVLARWLDEQFRTGDAAIAHLVIEQQRRTLGAMLARALEHHEWNHAYALAAPLDRYLNARGMVEEARGWVERALLELETPTGDPPDPQTAAGELWMFFVGAQASWDMKAGMLAEAEQTYQQIVAILSRQPPSDRQRSNLAVGYHHLGVVARHRGDLDGSEQWCRESLTINEELDDRPGMAASYHELGRVAWLRGDLSSAEQWHRKSLAIIKDLSDRPGMAVAYHQLGLVAYERGRLDAGGGHLDAAEQWFRKSLTIKEELGDRPEMAAGYHQLGMLAHRRSELGAAEQWYRNSLIVFEELGDRPGMASSYHQLGILTHDRWHHALTRDQSDLDTAEQWFRKSLTVNEELDDRPGMARAYHQLGMLAHDQSDLDTAEQWYRKSLSIFEELDDRPSRARTYIQMGRLAETRGHLTHALDWTIKGVTVFNDLDHPATRPARDILARHTAQLGVAALEQRWQHVTCSPLPSAMRDYVTAYEERMKRGLEEP